MISCKITEIRGVPKFSKISCILKIKRDMKILFMTSWLWWKSCIWSWKPKSISYRFRDSIPIETPCTWILTFCISVAENIQNFIDTQVTLKLFFAEYPEWYICITFFILCFCPSPSSKWRENLRDSSNLPRFPYRRSFSPGVSILIAQWTQRFQELYILRRMLIEYNCSHESCYTVLI